MDQNRYIGEDPVGHKCQNDADFETVMGVLLCRDCYVHFMNNSGRVTFPAMYGKTYQINMFNAAVKDVLGDTTKKGKK